MATRAAARVMLGTILQRLDNLTATVARLEAHIVAITAVPPRNVDTIDRETLSLLALHVGEQPFTARDVSALADTVPDLAHALDDVASLSPLAIGLWLTRMATTTTARGSRLTFQERGRDGNIWQFAYCGLSCVSTLSIVKGGYRLCSPN